MKLNLIVVRPCKQGVATGLDGGFFVYLISSMSRYKLFGAMDFVVLGFLFRSWLMFKVLMFVLWNKNGSLVFGSYGLFVLITSVHLDRWVLVIFMIISCTGSSRVFGIWSHWCLLVRWVMVFKQGQEWFILVSGELRIHLVSSHQMYSLLKQRTEENAQWRGRLNSYMHIFMLRSCIQVIKDDGFFSMDYGLYFRVIQGLSVDKDSHSFIIGKCTDKYEFNFGFRLVLGWDVWATEFYLDNEL